MPCYEEKNYMMAIYDRFCPRVDEDPEAQATATELRETLSEPQRKLLLRVEDALYAQRDDVAFDAFTAGFRVAVGLAMELRGGWYSFVADEERRAMNTFEQERDTI